MEATERLSAEHQTILRAVDALSAFAEEVLSKKGIPADVIVVSTGL